MASLTEVDSEAGFEQIIKTASPTTLFVLYFHTPWAAPCAQMNTILTTLASTYPADSDIRFLSINAEELADVSESYDVTAVPFLVLQRDGKVLETVSGSDAAKVRAVVEKYAGAGRTGTGGGIPPQLQATAPPQANGNADATKQQSSMTTATSGADVQQSQDELNERLAKLVKAAPVMLFMKGTPSAPQCGFSRQLVSILRENQVKYGFFNILADNDVREGLKVFSDWPTFPQLYTNGELVGGLDIVREELEADPDFFKPFAAPAPSS
ncbi:glutaredoxin [Exophiala dermatitidis]|uniref:Monothiol glutaredoxin n=2 Tax=Exophiala dermatitidis TaxID=5970 RepID=H6C5N5_EXODN|nr:monothiol glutaredoxin [Exophiala dermatitidis NIH/UT8656]KAJ4516369.1 glutaredoxin [Exophiala dermatitidis]EHY59031.1 monothiol glutaredoxin [Exophiala dermatitidis NIH/UT8656]KAJ4526504.1 glutaredoxin [Exophiala dermatitidis]KAJ4532250.1 glutaredoxin [Exophiala dermatitidis]KAJ4546286.1 glutaredoxin [Exophiala dermatitidis]